MHFHGFILNATLLRSSHAFWLTDHHVSCAASENFAASGNYEFRRVQDVTLRTLHYLFGITALGQMHVRGFLPYNGIHVMLGILHPTLFSSSQSQ